MSDVLHRYQRLLVDALIARIAATKQYIGDRYGFTVHRVGETTAVLAQRWPVTVGNVPFSRVFNYVASDDQPDLLSTIAPSVELVVEVMPSAHAFQTETHLHAHGFTSRWQIPWLHTSLDQPLPAPPLRVRPVASNEIESIAALMVAGYGYTGAQAAAWYDLARYGYTAPGFTCFVAEAEQLIAAGVVFIHNGLALVDGAATLPEQRGRGAQTSLLLARLAWAQARGCTHAVSRTGRSSISQRNMERLGLQVLTYSTAWQR